MYYDYPSFNKLYKTFIKVIVKTTRFAVVQCCCTEIDIALYDFSCIQNKICEVDQELGAVRNRLFLRVRGVGNRPPRQKLLIPKGMPGWDDNNNFIDFIFDMKISVPK